MPILAPDERPDEDDEDELAEGVDEVELAAVSDAAVAGVFVGEKVLVTEEAETPMMGAMLEVDEAVPDVVETDVVDTCSTAVGTEAVGARVVAGV